MIDLIMPTIYSSSSRLEIRFHAAFMHLTKRVMPNSWNAFVKEWYRRAPGGTHAEKMRALSVRYRTSPTTAPDKYTDRTAAVARPERAGLFYRNVRAAVHESHGEGNIGRKRKLIRDRIAGAGLAKI